MVTNAAGAEENTHDNEDQRKMLASQTNAPLDRKTDEYTTRRPMYRKAR